MVKKNIKTLVSSGVFYYLCIMKSKICRTCNVEKTINKFSIWSGRKSYRPDCKDCINNKQKKYLKENPETYSKVKKAQLEKYWVKRNEELPSLQEKIGKIKICTSCGYEGSVNDFARDASVKNSLSKVRLRGTCKPCKNIRQNEWVEKNPDKLKTYNKKTYNRRKKDKVFMEKRKEQQHIYYQRPEVKEKKREKDRINKQKPSGLWRRLLANALTQLKTVRPKQTRTLTLLGYTHETLFNIVGSKPEGNYHLDHSIPLSWMVSTTPPSIACHLDNLSWITEKNNLAKNNRYSNPVSESYFNILKTYIKPNFINRFIITDGVVYDLKKDFILEQWDKGESSVF